MSNPSLNGQLDALYEYTKHLYQILIEIAEKCKKKKKEQDNIYFGQYIFRLRTQHIPLHSHLNRIGAIAEKTCPLCGHPEETVEHHLFQCSNLEDLRRQLLPPQPDIHNTLFSTSRQLKSTCTFHYMSLSRRAKAQVLLVR